MSLNNDNELVQARRQLMQVQAELEEARKYINWLHDIIANPALSGNTAKVVIGIRREVDNNARRKNDSGLSPVWRDNLADYSGVSVQTVSSNITTLAKSGLIERQETRDKDQQKKHIFLGLSSQLVNRPSLVSPEKPLQGGKRVTCSSCGSVNMNVKTIITCKDCGTVHKTTEHDIKTDEQDIEEIVPYVHPQFEEPAEPMEVASYTPPVIAGAEPLSCPGCHHAHPEWWRWVDIRASWECLICRAYAPGRIAG